MKIFTFTIPGTVQFFETIGYPGFFAYLVILGEVGGGLALILGAWTRVVALALLPIMIGATLQHAGNGWMFAKTGGGWEFPAFWTVMLLVQALLGSGAYAVKLEKFLGSAGPAARRGPENRPKIKFMTQPAGVVSHCPSVIAEKLNR